MTSTMHLVCWYMLSTKGTAEEGLPLVSSSGRLSVCGWTRLDPGLKRTAWLFSFRRPTRVHKPAAPVPSLSGKHSCPTDSTGAFSPIITRIRCLKLRLWKTPAEGWPEQSQCYFALLSCSTCPQGKLPSVTQRHSATAWLQQLPALCSKRA